MILRIKRLPNHNLFNLLYLSIPHFVILFFPLAKSIKSFFTHEMVTADGAAAIVESQLLIDEGIAEVDGMGIIFCVCITDAADACPIEGTETHWTGFARRVYGAPFEFEIASLLTGSTHSHILNLAIRSRMCSDWMTQYFSLSKPIFIVSRILARNYKKESLWPCGKLDFCGNFRKKRPS